MGDILLLCYHAISDRWPAPLATAPEQFEAQLSALALRGYRSVTMTAAIRGEAPSRAVAITFDDAYASIAEQALPILTRAGFVASVFAPTAFVGLDTPMSWPETEAWLETEYRDELIPMGWDALAELADRGWEVGSHTQTHARLTELADADLARQLEDSRHEIAVRLGRPCASLAYPYGAFDRRVMAAARWAGYEAAAGTAPGRLRKPTGPFDWQRMVINRSDAGRRFEVKTSRAARRAMANPAWALVTRARRRVRSRRAGVRG